MFYFIEYIEYKNLERLITSVRNGQRTQFRFVYIIFSCSSDIDVHIEVQTFFQCWKLLGIIIIPKLCIDFPQIKMSNYIPSIHSLWNVFWWMEMSRQ